MTVSGETVYSCAKWGEVGARMLRNLTNSYDFFLKHLSVLCLFMLGNINHKSCWISANCCVEAYKLHFCQREEETDRNQDTDRQHPRTWSLLLLQAVVEKKMMTSRTKCLFHGCESSCFVFSVQRKNDQWKGLISIFLESKYKEF